MKKMEWLKPLSILRLGLSLLIAGQALPARELWASSPATAIISLQVVSSVAGNPTAITSLNAAPYFPAVPNEVGGGVVLSWSAPQSADGSPVYSYAIKYATFSASGMGYDAWWNSPNTLTALQNGTPTILGWLAQAATGYTETVTLTGLTPAAYYYFGVRARDKYFNIADYDSGLKSITNQAQTYAATLPLTPGKITSLVATANTQQVGAVNLSWTTPIFYDQNATPVAGKIYYPGQYCVQYSTTIPPAYGSANPPNLSNNWDSSTRIFVSTSNIQTNDHQIVGITGLMLPTTYYFLTFIRNEWPTHWSSIPTNYAAVQPYNTVKPINSLSASADASISLSTASYITLSWNNPTAENNLAGVRICYSTSTAVLSSTYTQHIDLAPETAGQAVQYQHLQLIPRTTYYYTVYTYNQNQIFFSAGVNTQCYTGKDYIAPDAVSNAAALATVDNSGQSDKYYMNLAWTTPSAMPYYKNSDYAGVSIYYSTYTQVSAGQQLLISTNAVNSQAQSFIQNNIAAFTTYYYSMFSYDSAGNVSTTPVLVAGRIPDALIKPAAPQVVTMLVSANYDPSIGSGIYLQWTTPPEQNIVGTRLIFRTDRSPINASDGAVWIDTAAVPNSLYGFSANQLIPSTTYYVAVFAYTSAGTYSRMMSVSIFTHVPWFDNLAPMAPLGLQITKASASTVVLSWMPVIYNADHTKFSNPGNPSMQDIYGYEVYRSTEIFGNWSQVGISNYAGTKVGINNYTATKYMDTIPAGLNYYYKIRSVDASANYNDSNIIGSNGCVYILCSDGSYIALDQGKVQNNLILTFVRETGEEKGPIIKSFEWEPYSVVDSTSSFKLVKINNFSSFDTLSSPNESNSGLFINYMTGVGANAKLAPALRTMSDTDIARDASIFYFNGVEWLKQGSTVDTESRFVTAKAKFAGKYQLRKSPQATEFTFYGVMPKIITPNNDRENDRAMFRYANPKVSKISIKIFNLKGALVKDLNDTTATSDIQGEYIYWDGTNDNGAIVPIGVYIYQLEGEGKIVNGTIVVAR